MHPFGDEIGDILARELYLSAGLDPTQAHGAPRVAAAVLGESCLHTVKHRDLPGRALLQRAGLGWTIHVRETLSARQLNHAVAHELGEWFLRCRGYAEPDIEALSSRVAAAICVPQLPFVAAHAELGEDLAALSRRFRVSESLVVLRIAECFGVPTALITEKFVITRGKPLEWPTTHAGWKDLLDRVRAKHETSLTLDVLGDSKRRVALRQR